MRRPLIFPCADDALVGTLDEAGGTTGLLIVTGGTQVRAGAHGGQARLAARVAAAGHPVFRFDRRGVGDSSGADPGFAASAPDIAAALASFRAVCPGLDRVIAFGLCDGATALALHHGPLAIDTLILANPWLVQPTEGLPPPAAIRQRYRHNIADSMAWKRLLTNPAKIIPLARGLRAARARRPDPLADQVARALAASSASAHVLLADGDATAIACADAMAAPAFRPLADRIHRHRLASAAHSFAPPADADWLAARVLAILDGSIPPPAAAPPRPDRPKRAG